MNDTTRIQQTDAQGGAGETEEGGRALLKVKGTLKEAFRTSDDQSTALVERGVRTLAEIAARDAITVGDDVVDTIKQYIARIDETLTRQINAIMHHDEFKRVESAWRGLAYLVNNTATDAKLQIKVMNVTKKEVHSTLKRYAGAKMDQSPLFRKIYEQGFGTLRGDPFGVLIGDYHFDAGGQDVEFLREMSKIAAAAHCPFITGASPKLLNIDSFEEMGSIPDIGEIYNLPQFAGWRSLRDLEDSRYLGLAMPRFLARLPYGSQTNPVDDFAFEEDVSGSDHVKYTWANSAYAMGVNITRAFKTYGWCSRIRGVESGGVVPNLPVHNFRAADGGQEMKSPTEVDITIRREAELARAGFMPLSHAQNEDFAAFIGAQSVNKPKEYDDPEATASAALGARLPYLFAVCRFAHYLQKMVYEKIGLFKERADIEAELNEWLNRSYILRDGGSDQDRAEKPLSDGQVTVEADPENPGFYNATFLLRPHYQLEGMSVSLKLASRVQKGS